MSQLRVVGRYLSDVSAWLSAVAGLAFGVVAILAGEWQVGVWAVAAGGWALAALRHRCPVPAEPERGGAVVMFIGGPADGAEVELPPVVGDLQGARVDAGGALYAVTAVDQTCYRAEVES